MDNCRNDCFGRFRKDPASIRFGAVGATDVLKANGRISTSASIDPSQIAVGIRLSDGTRVIYTAELPVGAMIPRKRKFRFHDADAKSNPSGGIADFLFGPHKDGYSIKVVAYGNLATAMTPSMSVEVLIASGAYKSTGAWIKRRHGWKLFDDKPVGP